MTSWVNLQIYSVYRNDCSKKSKALYLCDNNNNSLQILYQRKA